MAAAGDALLPFFQEATFSSSGLPNLLENEFIYVSKQACLLTTHPEQKFGTLTLTDRRLIFISDVDISNICKISANLSNIISQESPAKMFSRSTRIIIKLDTSMVSTLTNEHHLKFQSHNDAEEFGQFLQTSLDRKQWLIIEKEKEKELLKRTQKNTGPRVVGVSGIMRQREREKRETNHLATGAFQDLEALFSQANDVVQTITKYQAQIENLNKTTSSVGKTKEDEGGGGGGGGGGEEDEAEQMKDLLMTIGIQSPVTKSSYNSSKKNSNIDLYYSSLARELADFLLKKTQDPKNNMIEKSGGILTLLDAYCLWNRARCLDMISPDDFIECIKYFKQLNLNLNVRLFDSGLQVIQFTDSHSDNKMCEKILKMIINKTNSSSSQNNSGGGSRPNQVQGMHSFQISQLLNIPLSLTNEFIKIAEMNGYIVRDEYLEQVTYYPNLFKESITKLM